ncbi:unnamed protein product [Fraxinus pennsylvanica]|uniref:Expansin n=1 Tax=Fraxinus pennsylvanica TaxID=56036 RepID=A0AAD2DIL3_9LAMI|nr:unnamed protein product [Fraxinus pennsylvanica]
MADLHSWCFSFFLVMAVVGNATAAYYAPVFRPTAWKQAYATFYGDETAAETMGGACGYGNLFSSGYGTATAALSSVLFNNGYRCGQCFQIRCVKSQLCYRGSPITTITATNLCPPNWAKDSNNGGWCNPPRTHFDMSKPAFMKIAQWKAGIVPVMFRSFFLVMAVVGNATAAYYAPVFRPTAWKQAYATFYGDETAAETMGGACGYGNLFNSGYGTATAALSSVLFNNGYGCGQCFQIRCVKSQLCYRGSPITTITATNLCPPNWAKDSNNGGWCNPPRTHFDMSKPAFMKIAQWKAGIVPVMFRRVPCVRKGGLRFTFQGNGYWLLVYVMNVAGGGDIAQMWVKGSKTGWISMSHNWGASYQAFSTLGGQALSFKLTSYTSHETIIAWNVAPSNWQVGLTYSGNVNFH